MTVQTGSWRQTRPAVLQPNSRSLCIPSLCGRRGARLERILFAGRTGFDSKRRHSFARHSPVRGSTVGGLSLRVARAARGCAFGVLDAPDLEENSQLTRRP